MIEHCQSTVFARRQGVMQYQGLWHQMRIPHRAIVCTSFSCLERQSILSLVDAIDEFSSLSPMGSLDERFFGFRLGVGPLPL